MQTFLKIILFSCLLLLILLVIFKQTSGSFIIKERLVLDKARTKEKFFESFISNKQKINLILGSSLTEVLLIPEILVKNWFIFLMGHKTFMNR